MMIPISCPYCDAIIHVGSALPVIATSDRTRLEVQFRLAVESMGSAALRATAEKAAWRWRYARDEVRGMLVALYFAQSIPDDVFDAGAEGVVLAAIVCRLVADLAGTSTAAPFTIFPAPVSV